MLRQLKDTRGTFQNKRIKNTLHPLHQLINWHSSVSDWFPPVHVLYRFLLVPNKNESVLISRLASMVQVPHYDRVIWLTNYSEDWPQPMRAECRRRVKIQEVLWQDVRTWLAWVYKTVLLKAPEKWYFNGFSHILWFIDDIITFFQCFITDKVLFSVILIM